MPDGQRASLHPGRAGARPALQSCEPNAAAMCGSQRLPKRDKAAYLASHDKGSLCLCCR